MNESHIRNVIEAALLAAGKPLQPAELVELFDEGARPQVHDIQAAFAALSAEYSSRGIEIKETAAGFRIQVRREFANEISRLWPERPAKYSRALLETLALIAYRQPITRAEIEAVRGVAVNPNIIKTVIERNWVRVVGNRDVPGRPELLGTTRDFLDYFGLKSLDDLPPLAEIKALGEIKMQFELPDAGPVPVADGEAHPAAGAPDGAGAAEATAAVAASGASGEVGVGAASAVAAEIATASGAQAAGAQAAAAEGANAGGAEVANAGGAGGANAEGANFEGTGDEATNDAAIADQVLEAGVASKEGGGHPEADQDDSEDESEDESEHASESKPVVRAEERGGHDAAVGEPADSPDDKHAPLHSAQHEAEKFAANIDAELAAGDDDSSDDDELSAEGPSSSELVAGPRDLDD